MFVVLRVALIIRLIRNISEIFDLGDVMFVVLQVALIICLICTLTEIFLRYLILEM